MSGDGWGSGWDNEIVSQVIIVGPGGELLVYNPAIALGDLIASVAGSEFFESKGNLVLQGLASYGNDGENATQILGNTIFFWQGTTPGNPSTQEALINGSSSGIQVSLLGWLASPKEAQYFAIGGLGGGTYFVAPSGDTTGVTDAAFISNLLSGGAAEVRLLPGTFYVTGGQITVGPGQTLKGAGRSVTIIRQTSALGASWTVRVFSASGSSASVMATLADLTVDGTSAASNSWGIQAGDVSEIVFRDVMASNFGGGTGVGFLFTNSVNFSEQCHGQIYAYECDQCVVFGTSLSGANSMERWALDVWATPNTGGYGCILRNGVVLLNGRMALRGNHPGGGGAWLIMENTATIQQSFQLDIGAELDATSGTAPQTIDFAGGASNTIDAYGQMQFLQIAGGIAWAASNNSGNLNYQGSIYGDTTLLENVRTFDWTKITTGFPAGWSGTFAYRHNWNSGETVVKWELTIAAGTAATDGETILSGLPAHIYNASLSNPLPAFPITGGGIAAGTFVAASVTSGGVFELLSANFTPAGTSAFWFGQATYNNSI